MNNHFDVIISRPDTQLRKKISHLEDMLIEISQNEMKRSKNKQTERADSRSKKTTILQPVAQKPHSQKDRQDEKAEGYVPDGGTR